VKRLAPIAMLAVAVTAHAASEEVITIPTREGVTLSYLLVREPAAVPKVVVVSFPGGTGAINLAKRAAAGPLKYGPTVNFLIRARAQFADADFADVIVDAPSDQLPNGMSDEFRLSPEHAADIRALLGDVRKRFPDARVYLIGTSRGTISVAMLAASLGDAVQGAVLSSTVTKRDRMGPSLSAFDFSTIKIPVLLLHHRQDGCFTSPYTGAERLSKQFPLVSVSGGDAPQTGPCEPLSPHGYTGLDAEVTKAVRRWMLGRDYAHEIP